MLSVFLGSSTGILSIVTILGATATVGVCAIVWYVKSGKKTS